MNDLEIIQIPILSDNYVYLLKENKSQTVAVVDPGLAAPVLAELQKRQWPLHWIINTHHHWDHTDGNQELKEKTKCKIVGPLADQDRIPGIDQALDHGETFQLGETSAEIFFVPGHTRGHIAYWFKDEMALFCGDVIFGMGCGRLFEGTPKQMHQSLHLLSQLPDETRVFCAHEYTEKNSKFALELEPQNQALQKRAQKVAQARRLGKPTVPFLLKEERETNPFFRTSSQEIRDRVSLSHATDLEIFSEVRMRRNRF